jgi:hypothetical protein
MKFNTFVHLFPFDLLTVTRLYQLTWYILETLHRIAPRLSASSDYTRLKEEFEQFSEVFNRNPALLQTKELWRTTDHLRDVMKTLGNLLTAFADYGGVRQTYAEQLSYLVRPNLKPHPSSMAIPDLLAKSGRIAVDLQTPATTPMVTALDLTALVTEIDTLSHAADALYGERSSEKELRHLLGSATKRRSAMTEALEIVLYSLIQALHSLAANAADRAELDEVINQINGYLDSYKIYAKGSSSSNDSGSGTPDYPADGDDEEEPDDGGNGNGGSEDPEPPAGGNENPGGDGGSGGPLDRGGIVINIKE